MIDYKMLMLTNIEGCGKETYHWWFGPFIIKVGSKIYNSRIKRIFLNVEHEKSVMYKPLSCGIREVSRPVMWIEVIRRTAR